MIYLEGYDLAFDNMNIWSCSFAAASWHQRGPSYLLAPHRGVHHFLAHRLLDCAHGLVPWAVANCLLKLRIEDADRQVVPTIHLFNRILKFLLQPKGVDNNTDTHMRWTESFWLLRRLTVWSRPVADVSAHASNSLAFSQGPLSL